jgi:hypothetical protein
MKEKRIFEDRHKSTKAYIDYMRPRCVELYRVLKNTCSFYYHCDWHASHYVKTRRRNLRERTLTATTRWMLIIQPASCSFMRPVLSRKEMTSK